MNMERLTLSNFECHAYKWPSRAAFLVEDFQPLWVTPLNKMEQTWIQKNLFWDLCKVLKGILACNELVCHLFWMCPNFFFLFQCSGNHVQVQNWKRWLVVEYLQQTVEMKDLNQAVPCLLQIIKRDYGFTRYLFIGKWLIVCSRIIDFLLISSSIYPSLCIFSTR